MNENSNKKWFRWIEERDANGRLVYYKVVKTERDVSISGELEKEYQATKPILEAEKENDIYTITKLLTAVNYALPLGKVATDERSDLFKRIDEIIETADLSVRKQAIKDLLNEERFAGVKAVFEAIKGE